MTTIAIDGGLLRPAFGKKSIKLIRSVTMELALVNGSFILGALRMLR
jgi:hypothetical protein